ncbi:MAG: J domain-containing protein [Methanomicrobiales archaeon]|nr:J domain-containing protein [Methanomicrobiales archaeon]
MNTTQDMTIQKAAELLGFSDKASLLEIRKRYHELTREWHPDVSSHSPDESHEMMIRIKEAYEILIEYCMNYQITFKDEMSQSRLKSKSMQYWQEHFGDDPIWG